MLKGERKEKGRNLNNLKSLIGFLCNSTIKHTSRPKAEVGFVDQEGQGKPGKKEKVYTLLQSHFLSKVRGRESEPQKR